MRPLTVEVLSEFRQLALKVDGIPEEDLIEMLSPDGTDESLHEGMRQRDVWHCLDLIASENSEVGFPSMEEEQRVVVRAQIVRESRACDRLVEHPAKARTIDITDLHTKPDDPTRVVVHRHHDQ